MQYKRLVDLYQKIEGTTKRLEKTYFVSEFLKTTDVDDIRKIILLLQGKVFPPYDPRTLGVASRMVIKAISKSFGITPLKIENEWKRTGDLGDTAEYLAGKKRQSTLFSQQLTVNKVFNNLVKMASMEGSGAVDRKVGLVSELLTSASPVEARYIIRTVLEDLRVGIGEGVLRDSIVWAFFDDTINVNYDDEKKAINPENRETLNMYVEKVQEAYNVLNDFSQVAELAKTSGLTGLKSVSVEAGKPLKVMLYPKAQGIAGAFDTVGRPAAIEYKYDGFRLQIHKKAGKITLFTRRLEDVTPQFPEVVDYVSEHVKGKEFILDAEAVGYDPNTKKYLAFQKISQRIKRKYNIAEMAKDFPVEVNIFDIIDHEGMNLLKEPFKERRKIIENIVKPSLFKIRPAQQIVTADDKEAEDFYKESLAAGEEGVMFKNLEGIYKPGSRVGYGVKVKPVMESLDLVIVGAEWGEGKRSGWFTSFTLACYDKDKGEFLEIGKVGTGIKELEGSGLTFEQLTEMLKPLVKQEKGRSVRFTPQLVIEINYEEIQKSPTYSSGYALRFPRVIRVREDRAPDECSDIELIESFYSTQRSR
ncbi:TPA: ATP-dependent DNA ligase [Candidatus Woesearchaeota archaeon]|nr:ATP-dependent DNA ligase [Candidatus Woesearchaeota archaeon]